MQAKPQYCRELQCESFGSPKTFNIVINRHCDFTLYSINENSAIELTYFELKHKVKYIPLQTPNLNKSHLGIYHYFDANNPSDRF